LPGVVPSAARRHKPRSPGASALLVPLYFNHRLAGIPLPPSATRCRSPPCCPYRLTHLLEPPGAMSVAKSCWFRHSIPSDLYPKHSNFSMHPLLMVVKSNYDITVVQLLTTYTHQISPFPARYDYQYPYQSSKT